MAASVQLRPQNRDLGMVMREVDEDLAIFLGMQNGGKERKDHLLIGDSDEFDDSTGAEPKPDSLLIQKTLQPETVQIVADDNFLNLEIDRSDYDWLLMQRDISLLPSEEVQGQDLAVNQTEISNGEGIPLKSELGNTSEESASLTNSALQLGISTSLDSSVAANRRSLSSGDRKPTPRAATPTGRPALPAKSRPSRASTPTSRATLESRASSATSRATFTSSKPMAAQARSSTPSRSTSRSSTPTSRSTVPVSSKSASRSATPTRKPATPSTTSSIFASDRSSSGRKTGSTMLKNPVPSHGTSQTVKSRPSKPSEMLSLSHDAPQNPKTSMPKRPASASRGRPSTPATHLPSSNGKPRQKSCSPAKVRAPSVTAHKIGNIMLSRSRGYSNGGGDDVNPVLIGTKMVERVVNMRKLAPPKQDGYISLDNPRKSSLENSGFGRSLSKKSLDMAIRHMDIRRSIPDNLRPVATAVLSSSACGIQSSSSTSSTAGVSESPHTSSSGSSKSSNCINSYFLDGSQMDY
ncbi:hypothetical protein Pfo_029914 [Paulownia fortunei]|nr:hypothetical protein Pfo_029914 [Paulownia fortunei]